LSESGARNEGAGTVISASWVLPVDGPPFRDGAVAVEGGRIAWVGPRPDLPSRFLRQRVRAYPRSLLLPGWVNAHSHLNLTAALGQVPGSAADFAGWVRRLIALRAQWPPRIVSQAIRAGLDLLASTGTTTTAHVDTLPELDVFLSHPLRTVVFHEAIGFPEARADGLLAEAAEWLDAAAAVAADAGVGERARFGVAAHAPYSASPRLIAGLRALATARRIPFSMHVAETLAEAEFVREGGGPLRGLLEERGAWDPAWRVPGGSPVGYLDDLGVLRARPESPVAAVHTHYLSGDDAALLAKGGAAAVWCPGSHQFFGHPPHPAPALLAAGVPVALGTDSLASNAGLNMLREFRLAASAHPAVPRDQWLRAGTLAGAQALGLEAETGSLTVGKAADLQVLEAAADEETDPLRALCEDGLRIRLVLVDGVEITMR
jgi:cytosine/adenosine deaminase-related metal-dependent hydrolase